MSSPDVSQRLHLPGRALAVLLAGARREGQPDAGVPAPQTHFGGKFRSVDFALSNCLNSGIRRMGVVSPFRSHSLQRHLKRGWSFLKGDGSEFIALLPAEAQRCGGTDAQENALLALSAVRDLLLGSSADYVLVLTGDRIYKMNYASMLADHVAKGRDCTVACLEASPDHAPAGRLLSVDARWRVTACHPANVDQAGKMATSQAQATPSWRSMGIYVFNRNHLLHELARDLADPGSEHDFENTIVAPMVRAGRASAHPFALSCVGSASGKPLYWRDVGTVDAYWDANIDLTASLPQLDLYDPHWPMRAQQAELAPAKFLHNEASRRGMAVESLVSGGSIISGSVQRSVLFPSVRIHSYASVAWSVLLPAVQVGRHARLNRVVVDRGCSIPDGMVIGEDAQADAARFYRTERGITLVTADMLARLPSAGVVQSNPRPQPQPNP